MQIFKCCKLSLTFHKIFQLNNIELFIDSVLAKVAKLNTLFCSNPL